MARLLMLIALGLLGAVQGALRGTQPQDAFGGGPVGVSMDDDTPPRPPGYRNAWDDCGGAGASATERMRSIAASIKGFAKDVPWKRSAAQDCGSIDASGLKPGPGTEVVYPNPGVLQAATQGLMTASLAKEKFAPKL